VAERADDLDQRTEMPTPLRLAEMRRRGRVAQSRDLTSVLVILLGAGLLAVLGGGLLDELRTMIASMLSDAGRVQGGSALAQELAQVTWRLVVRLLPLLAGLAVAAVAANVVQFGFLATAETIKPDLGRLSVVGGIGRMFSRRAWVRAGLAAFKILAVSAAGYWAIRGSLPRLVGGDWDERWISQLGWAAAKVTAAVGGVLLALAVADLLYQRWQFRVDLKMTRREVLDEARRGGGDKQLGNARRKLGWRMMQASVGAIGRAEAGQGD
jgi:flagellar biosynthetic protein FlhB